MFYGYAQASKLFDDVIFCVSTYHNSLNLSLACHDEIVSTVIITVYLPGLSPFNYSNLSFDTVDEEVFSLPLSNVIHASCPPNPNKWKIIFAVKPMKPSGLLFLMSGEDFQSFIAVTIDMRNIVFCLRYESFYEERKVPLSDFSNGWLYMKLEKSEEKGLRFSVNGGKKQMINPFVQNYSLARISNSFKCHGDVFFGSIPKTLKQSDKQKNGILRPVYGLIIIVNY
ncbi:hypothetical protein BC332_34670 [Capsicum chinense]|nr:hypothetical protein BC332_34670 [Capsicum chinense]